MDDRQKYNSKYAIVKLNNIEDTIDHHLQMSKRFLNHQDMKFLDLQNKQPDYFIVKNNKFPIEYFNDFQKLLWYRYLKENENLLEELKLFHPTFENLSETVNNVYLENIIKNVINIGFSHFLNETKEFIELLRQENKLLLLHKNILNSKQNMIIQEVNCSGICVNNLYHKIIRKFPIVRREYENICRAVSSTELMGECLFVDCEDKIIANIFSQREYTYSAKMTDFSSFKRCLFKVKDFAINHKLSVAIPFGIGCNQNMNEWETVKNVILEVFNDYPIIGYKEKN